MSMDRGELVTEAVECLREGKELVQALDKAPAMIRAMPQAKQARSVSVRALKVIAELVRRLPPEQQQGGESGDDK